MRHNDRSDEDKLMRLIVSVILFFFQDCVSNCRGRGVGGVEIVTPWEVSVLTERKNIPIQDRERDTQRISWSIFHRAKALSGHLQVFLTFPLTPCFLLSLFFHSIATLPGGERNKPWTAGRGRSENRVNRNSRRVSLRCVCVCAQATCVGIHRQTSGDVQVPAGYKAMLKKQCRSAAE